MRRDWENNILGCWVTWVFPGGSNGKESACNVGDWASIPGLGRPLWRRAWQPTLVFVPGESPWTEEPGGLQSTGSQRVGHNWANKHTHWVTQLWRQDLNPVLYNSDFCDLPVWPHCQPTVFLSLPRPSRFTVIYACVCHLLPTGIWGQSLCGTSFVMLMMPCVRVRLGLRGRRQWHPTPVLLPGKSHEWRSLVGCLLWGRRESDTTEAT